MKASLNRLQCIERSGEIEAIIGLQLVANGPPHTFVGEVCLVLDEKNRACMQAEVLGFSKGKVYLMPYDKVKVRMGSKLIATGEAFAVPVGNALLGQVVDAFARPVDPLLRLHCSDNMPTTKPKINPLLRLPVTEQLLTGVTAIDALLPIGKGQRVGIFAGSGVGKSSLLGHIAQHIDSDINVIALIGERGREVKDFICNYLSEETKKKTVLVVACSDESALMRRQAAFTATAIAEYFCKQGKQVMLLMDSITRFAMAQREIGLSLGEPPTARGYTPSVFAMLPGLVERAGAFEKEGSISAIYTVLVEGDDFNEPLADHMRSLLDGHIVLTRELAEQGHYPAIAITQSISRLSRQLLSEENLAATQAVRNLLCTYQQHKDLIDLGAYKAGSNPKLDYALERLERINLLLTANKGNFEQDMQAFKEVLG